MFKFTFKTYNAIFLEYDFKYIYAQYEREYNYQKYDIKSI